MRRRGFSLLEITLSVGIIAVIVGVSMAVLVNRRSGAELEAAGSRAVAMLRQAQTNANQGVNGTPWGVRFDNSTTTRAFFGLFASSTYATSTERDHYALPTRISYDSASLAVGGTRDVVFGERTGRPTATSTIILKQLGSERAYEITISSSGSVEGQQVASASGDSGSAPSVASLIPTSGSSSGSVNVSSITGSGFAVGATVKLTRSGQSDISGSGFSVTNGTTMTGGSFPIAGAQAGTWNVVVTNPDNQSGTCSNCFTVNSLGPAPTVTNVATSSLFQGQTQNLTITGTNFVSGATVAFSGTEVVVNNVTFNSATSLTANVTVTNYAAASARNVTVTNPDTQQGVCAGCFTVSQGQPLCYTITPGTIRQGAATTTITLTGYRYAADTYAYIHPALTYGVNVGSSTVASSTQLSFPAFAAATSSMAPGQAQKPIYLATPSASQTGGCADYLWVTAGPTSQGPSPGAVDRGQTGVAFTINGTGFDAGAAVTFSGGGITVTSTTVATSTLITGTIDIDAGADTTYRDVTITNPDGSSTTTAQSFLVTNPPILSDTGWLLPAYYEDASTPAFQPPDVGDWFTDEEPHGNGKELGRADQVLDGQVYQVKFTEYPFNFYDNGGSLVGACVLLDDVGIENTIDYDQRLEVAIAMEVNNPSSYSPWNTLMPDLQNTNLDGDDYYYDDKVSTPTGSAPSSCTTWNVPLRDYRLSYRNFGVVVRTFSNNANENALLRLDTAQLKLFYSTPQ